MNPDEWNKLTSREKAARVDELPELSSNKPTRRLWDEIRSVCTAASSVVLMVLMLGVFLSPICGLYRCQVTKYKDMPDSLERRAPITAALASNLNPLRGSIYPGTRVYDAAGSYVGTITSVQSTKPNRSFTFQYADGSLATKDWDAALGFNWYVQR